MKDLVLDDLYFYRAKKIMKILGVWIPKDDENKMRKLYKYFMLTLQFIFLLFQIIYVAQVWGDLEAVSEALYVMVTQACLCCKITVFHVNVEIIRVLLDQMNGEIFKPQNSGHERILKKQAKKIKLLLFSFIVGAEMICGLWGLKPLFDDVGIRKFPFDMWMPINPNYSPQYQLGYMFQVMTICISALMYFGVDSVAISMVIFACAQMQIIMDKIMSCQISPRPAKYLVGVKMTRTIQAVNYYGAAANNIQPFFNPQIKPSKNRDEDVSNPEEYHEKGNDTLMACIKHHQAVVNFTESVGEAFHIYFLFQLTGAVGLIVMSAYRILVIERYSMQFVSLIFYLIVMTSQIYLLCLSGHELTATSEDLRTVFYSCVWYEQDIKFQRALHFAMMRMSRPVVLRVGNYVTLSRQTFVTILRMSYSYIAVLNQTK